MNLSLDDIIEDQRNLCLKLNIENECLACNRQTPNWYCFFHYLLKEVRYGLYDLETKNKGFEKWGIERLIEFERYVVGSSFEKSHEYVSAKYDIERWLSLETYPNS